MPEAKDLCIAPISDWRQNDGHGKYAVRIETGSHRAELSEALRKKTRRHEEHHGQRDLS